MKPTLPTNKSSSRRDSLPVASTASCLSHTNSQFKANGPADFGRCHGSPAPSFRRIGQDYFTNEAPGHFLSEAVLFVLMVVTAAVPVIEGMRGAMHYVRLIGVL